MKTISGVKTSHVKAPKYPTKRTVNLAQRESHSRSTLTLSLGLLIILLLSFCVANFGVLRQLDRQRAAEQAYSTAHSQYSPVYVPVDRMEVLDLVQEYLMPYGTVNTLVVDEDVMIVTMSDMNLEQISAMFQRLQLQPAVKAATLTLAATPSVNPGDKVDFSITVTLRSAAEREATQ